MYLIAEEVLCVLLPFKLQSVGVSICRPMLLLIQQIFCLS